MKHKLKNIANRPIPVDGTDLRPKSGEIIEADITPRLLYLIKNKFFEDLGEVERKPVIFEGRPKLEEKVIEEKKEETVKKEKDSVWDMDNYEEKKDLSGFPAKKDKPKGKKKRKKNKKEMI